MSMISLLRLFIGIGICSLLFTPVVLVADQYTYPAFEDHVSGSTSLINMQSFALESSLKTNLVGADGTPLGVSYMVSVSPLNGTEAAIGTVRTNFAGSVREARGTGSNASAENQWKDSAYVSGSIIRFMKTFEYTSGIRL